jgi:hypothetical protein
LIIVGLSFFLFFLAFYFILIEKKNKPFNFLFEMYLLNWLIYLNRPFYNRLKRSLILVEKAGIPLEIFSDLIGFRKLNIREKN